MNVQTAVRADKQELLRAAREEAYSTPLKDFHPGAPKLFQNDTLWPWFERLRKEEPVHYCTNAPIEPYWSVTKYNDIMHVDTNHGIFSSDSTLGGISIRDALIEAGRASNYGEGTRAAYVYLTATLDAATWGAELAAGDGRGRIYFVEPTGPIEDDPNLTDKRFPGNPTQSFRTREPLRVVGELVDWVGHSPEKLQSMRDGLDSLKRQGAAQIAD